MDDKVMTVALSGQYLEILTKWASVSRTLSTAKQACEDAGLAVTAADVEKYNFCSQELSELIPALDHLHKQVQQQIWHS